MLKEEQLLILKKKYEELYNYFSSPSIQDGYKFITTWLENDIYRLTQEIESGKRNIYNPMTAQIYIPIDLEKKARKDAKNIGLIKDDDGNLSSYVNLLINNDLKNTQIINKKMAKGRDIEYNTSEQKRISIYLEKNLQKHAKERALELGLIWGGEGNLSQYIKLLITLGGEEGGI